jgi:hypothetical protein
MFKPSIKASPSEVFFLSKILYPLETLLRYLEIKSEPLETASRHLEIKYGYLETPPEPLGIKK